MVGVFASQSTLNGVVALLDDMTLLVSETSMSKSILIASDSESADSTLTLTDSDAAAFLGIAITGTEVLGVDSVIVGVDAARIAAVAPPSSSPSSWPIVQTHFLFFSFLRFLIPLGRGDETGVSVPKPAIRRRISSNGPGVSPPFRVSSPEYAMARSSIISESSFTGEAEYGDASSASKSM